jgi:hypothetical protein
VKIIYPEEFTAFWKAYPRPVAKGYAYTMWKRHRDVPPDVIMEALERCKEEWAAGKRPMNLIPHPSSWLNQRRWEDEHPATIEYRTPDSSAGIDCGHSPDVPGSPDWSVPF